jgi:hypothetical protein
VLQGAIEFDLRFGSGPQGRRFWGVIGVLWSSEAPTAPAVREAVLTAAYRAAYVRRHGPARTLRDMLAQEGQVMAMAGCTGPVLDAEDLAYTREVLAPHLDAGDMRTAVECLFGDAAGRTLGFTSRGLSPWAGLALALHDARRDAVAAPIFVTHGEGIGSILLEEMTARGGDLRWAIRSPALRSASREAGWRMPCWGSMARRSSWTA